MSKPLISLVMPTYNRAKYVPMAIRCFYQQAYSNLELVIVDDGIETLSIPADGRIQYIHLDTRTTTGTKRNLGAAEARGEIIASLDDDDWSHPHRIEDEFQRLMSSGKAVTGYNQTIAYDGEASKRFMLNMGGPPYPASGTSQMYWKSWWEQHPYPDMACGEDSEFSFTAIREGQLAIGKVGKMMIARRHANNTCQYRFPGPCERHKELQPSEISSYFFEALHKPSPTLEYMQVSHASGLCCQEAKAQFQQEWILSK